MSCHISVRGMITWNTNGKIGFSQKNPWDSCEIFKQALKRMFKPEGIEKFWTRTVIVAAFATPVLKVKTVFA